MCVHAPADAVLPTLTYCLSTNNTNDITGAPVPQYGVPGTTMLVAITASEAIDVPANVECWSTDDPGVVYPLAVTSGVSGDTSFAAEYAVTGLSVEGPYTCNMTYEDLAGNDGLVAAQDADAACAVVVGACPSVLAVCVR